MYYIETIFIELPQEGKQNIVIGCIYRPSNIEYNAAVVLFNAELNQILTILDRKKNKIIF